MTDLPPHHPGRECGPPDRVPDEADWRPWADHLDVIWARKHFFGKSRDEARAMFDENALAWSEALLFMPTACLRFYLRAFLDHLESGAGRGNASSASIFFLVVEHRADDLTAFGEPEIARVRATLRRLADEQERSGPVFEIFGDFRQQADACLTRLRRA